MKQPRVAVKCITYKTGPLNFESQSNADSQDDRTGEKAMATGRTLIKLMQAIDTGRYLEKIRGFAETVRSAKKRSMEQAFMLKSKYAKERTAFNRLNQGFNKANETEWIRQGCITHLSEVYANLGTQEGSGQLEVLESQAQKYGLLWTERCIIAQEELLELDPVSFTNMMKMFDETFEEYFSYAAERCQGKCLVDKESLRELIYQMRFSAEPKLQIGNAPTKEIRKCLVQPSRISFLNVNGTNYLGIENIVNE